MQTAFVTGADRGLGLSMTRRLAEKGWRVFAGSYLPDWPELGELAGAYPKAITIIGLDIASTESVQVARDSVGASTDRVDLIINNAAVSSPVKERTIREKQDYSELLRVYNVNAIGALRVIDAFLPLTVDSDLKRLCFVSSEAGSMSRSERISWFGYCMSKTSLNMGVKLLFNSLRSQGYTFRLFHPGWMKTYMAGTKNMEAQLEPDDVAAAALAYFINPRCEGDEDRLVMRDWRGREWPW